MMKSYLAIIFVTAAVLNLVKGWNRAPNPRLAGDNPLICGEQLPRALQFQPVQSHLVWKPRGSGRSEGFERRSYSMATLSSIFSASLGTIDLNQQSLTIPTDSTLAPRVSRTLSVNEVFPADSPFLSDQNNLNITNLEFRNSVFNVGVGQCSLFSEWVDLGEFFFPRYYTGSRCEQAGCSVPSGLLCHPDITENPDYLYVLNWDCCYVNSLYTCGWRKVQIPVLTFCTCGCSPKLQPDE